MNLFRQLTLTALLLSSAIAQGAEGQYPITGVGVMSCGQWIETRELKDETADAMMTSWIQGFLSGMNTQRYRETKQEMVMLPDAPTLVAYVYKACRDDPLSSAYPILIQLYLDIQK